MPITTTWLRKPYEVQDIDDVSLVFPTGVAHLMPAWDDIPREFKSWNSGNRWNKLVSQWFFRGLSKLELLPKEGVDEKKALRHIKTVMGSWEPKHEHKEAACAYLMSLWFEDVEWEAKAA